MPRYFFSLRDHTIETDDVGTELPDISAARVEAIRFAGEMLRDQPELLDDNQTLFVWVTDEAGGRPFQLEVRAAGSST